MRRKAPSSTTCRRPCPRTASCSAKLSIAPTTPAGARPTATKPNSGSRPTSGPSARGTAVGSVLVATAGVVGGGEAGDSFDAGFAVAGKRAGVAAAALGLESRVLTACSPTCVSADWRSWCRVPATSVLGLPPGPLVVGRDAHGPCRDSNHRRRGPRWTGGGTKRSGPRREKPTERVSGSSSRVAPPSPRMPCATSRRGPWA